METDQETRAELARLHAIAKDRSWTRDEHDAYRRAVLALHPWFQFAPSSRTMAERFGGR